MHSIEKTAVIESNFYFNTEETAMFGKFWNIFTIFRETLEEIGEQTEKCPCLIVTNKEGEETRIYEEDIDDILDKIYTFNQNASIKAVGI